MTNSLLDIASLYIGLPDLNCIGLRVDGFVQKYDYSPSRVRTEIKLERKNKYLGGFPGNTSRVPESLLWAVATILLLTVVEERISIGCFYWKPSELTRGKTDAGLRVQIRDTEFVVQVNPRRLEMVSEQVEGVKFRREV